MFALDICRNPDLPLISCPDLGSTTHVGTCLPGETVDVSLRSVWNVVGTFCIWDDDGRHVQIITVNCCISWPVGSWRWHVPAARVIIVDRCWIGRCSLAVSEEQVVVHTILCQTVRSAAESQLHVPSVVCCNYDFDFQNTSRSISAGWSMLDLREINGSMSATDVSVTIAAVLVHAEWIIKITFVIVSTWRKTHVSMAEYFPNAS